MSYVLVTADFPSVTTEQRDKIYIALANLNWIKVKEFGRDISTVWYGEWGSLLSESQAIQNSISEFVNCASPYCKPKLVLHFGTSRPTFHGLT